MCCEQQSEPTLVPCEPDKLGMAVTDKRFETRLEICELEGLDESDEPQASESLQDPLRSVTEPCDRNNDEEIDISESLSVPGLDDPVTNDELRFLVKSVNKNKSYSGLCPGVFGELPPQWIFFFLGNI